MMNNRLMMRKRKEGNKNNSEINYITAPLLLLVLTKIIHVISSSSNGNKTDCFSMYSSSLSLLRRCAWRCDVINHITVTVSTTVVGFHNSHATIPTVTSNICDMSHC